VETSYTIPVLWKLVKRVRVKRVQGLVWFYCILVRDINMGTNTANYKIYINLNK